MMHKTKYSILYLNLIVLTSVLLITSPTTYVHANDGDFNPPLDDILDTLPRDDYYLNSTYYNVDNIQYKMLMILPDDSKITGGAGSFSNWNASIQAFAEWKQLIGLPTIVITNHTSYDGVDEPEKIRNAIISYYEKYPIEWVLLVGDTDYLPTRYVLLNDTEVVGVSESYSNLTHKPTDFYYAELTSDWDIDEDGDWGEDSINVQGSDMSELDFNAEVYVGRFPVETEDELNALIDKTINYERADYAGEWMSKFLGVSGISNYASSSDPDGEYEARLTQYIFDDIVGNQMNWTHYLEYSTGYTPTWIPNKIMQLSNYDMLNFFNDYSASIALFAGHGSTTSFAPLDISYGALSVSQLSSLNNLNKPIFLYGDACSTNSFDQEGGLGEEFMLLENAGGIGYVGCTRVSWYYPNDDNFIAVNRANAKLFFKVMFEDNIFQQGKALYESKRQYINSPYFKYGLNLTFYECERKNILCYQLLGDPSVNLYTQNPDAFNFEFEAVEYTNMYKEIPVRDQFNQPITDAKLVIFSNGTGNDVYTVFNADEYGIIRLRLPDVAGDYNYTLSGHNKLYEIGSIHIEEDTTSPQIIDPLNISTLDLSIDDNIDFNVSFKDNESGLCDSYFVLINFDLKTITAYPLSYDSTTNNTDTYLLNVPKLIPGTYGYEIVAFDYSNNINSTYGDSISHNLFTIPEPLMSEIYKSLFYIIIGIIGVSSVIIVIKRSSLNPNVAKESSVSNSDYINDSFWTENSVV